MMTGMTAIVAAFAAWLAALASRRLEHPLSQRLEGRELAR